MNFVIRFVCLVFLSLFSTAISAEMRENVLRNAVLKNGLKRPREMIGSINLRLAKVGEQLFESKLLSFNSDMSCKTCHLDNFSSADGLPNAVGVGGIGEGLERMQSAGKIVPRNVLPLWGRGSNSFDAFFWDGKVEKTDVGIVSQFGTALPSDDPLTVAVHLPFVEIREMVIDDDQGAGTFATESIEDAAKIYEKLALRVRSNNELALSLSKVFNLKINDIKFGHIASAIAEHIRNKFRIKSTKLHEFVFNDGHLNKIEVSGGLLFYGKGRCVLCHNGSMFTDFQFHAIPLPQTGFGKNGFGQDFGRYNITFDPRDAYLFRTPPLYNVLQTSPYGHSGSVYDLNDVIKFHVDPLWNNQVPDDLSKRKQLYGQLQAWSRANISFEPLNEEELSSIISFLGTLSFDDSEN